MRRINLDKLRPADRLVLPKSDLAFVQHHVVFLWKNSEGKRVYIENHIGTGVRMVYENDLFSDRQVVTRIEDFKGTDLERQEAVGRAIKLIGRPYDLINFNCEHYANTVQHNKLFSDQVSNGILAGLLIMFLGLSLSK